MTLHIGFPAHQYYQLTIMYKHQEMQRRGDFPKPSGCSAWVGLMVTSCNLQLTTDFGLVLGLVLVAILLKMSLLAPKRAHMWQKFICLANPLCDVSKQFWKICFSDRVRVFFPAKWPKKVFLLDEGQISKNVFCSSHLPYRTI